MFKAYSYPLHCSFPGTLWGKFLNPWCITEPLVSTVNFICYRGLHCSQSMNFCQIDLDFRYFSKYNPCSSLPGGSHEQPPCLCSCCPFLLESPLLSSALPLPIYQSLRVPLHHNATEHALIWSNQMLFGFQHKKAGRCSEHGNQVAF